MPIDECPTCGAPLAFTFIDTAGVGAWKRGDGYNTTPDTRHYACFARGGAWKRRLDGPLTPDVVGQLAFFTCRQQDCGAVLSVIRESIEPVEVELACPHGHRYRVQEGDDGGLMLADAEP
jgi:hypothetical protein